MGFQQTHLENCGRFEAASRIVLHKHGQGKALTCPLAQSSAAALSALPMSSHHQQMSGQSQIWKALISALQSPSAHVGPWPPGH